jgi:hypothetical protein
LPPAPAPSGPEPRRSAHGRAREDAVEQRPSGDGPLSAVEQVLLLQRTAGNALTSALLDGHAAPPTDREAGKGPKRKDKPLKGLFSDLLGWVGETVESVRGKKPVKGTISQDVTVTPVAAAKDLGRGGFEWNVWFSIPMRATNDGWVIQEIDADAKITKSDGTVDREIYHFWEAWELKKGKKVTVWQDQALDTNDDSYYTGPRPAGSKGKDVTYGKVRFFEGPLPADFKTNNPATVAGILHSSTTKPPFWSGTMTKHDLISEWDDSVAPPKTSIKTEPK